jgi:hypothetical protein
MACPQCISDCCHRWCVEELLCAMECCGCCDLPTLFGPNLNIQAGQLIAQKDDDLRFYPFDPAATDGTQNLLGVARYHIQTNAEGRVLHRYFNPMVPSSECGPIYSNRYVCGLFRTQDIIGDIAAARASGRLLRVEGNDSAGLVKFV